MSSTRRPSGGRGGPRNAAGGRGGWRSLPPAVRRDLAALALAAAAALGIVSLYRHPSGGVEHLVAAVLRGLVGVLAPAGPVILIAAALWLIFAPGRHVGARGLGALLLLLAAAGFAHLGVARPIAFAEAWRGGGGGLVGASLDWVLSLGLGPSGRTIVLAALGAAGLLLMTHFSLRAVLSWPFRHGTRAAGGVGRALYEFVTEEVPDAGPPARAGQGGAAAGRGLPGPVLDIPLLPEGDAPPASGRRRPRGGAGAGGETDAAAPGVAELPPAPAWGAAADPADDVAVAPPGAASKPERRRAREAAPEGEGEAEADDGAGAAEAAASSTPLPLAPGVFYQPPPLDLMRRLPRGRAQRGRDGTQRAAAVEEALKSFGVVAQVVDVVQGPSVTRFEVHPGAGVKVARISALADDLALALAATDVRIVAPIPGKAAVGIEVPNTDVTPVYLRDVIETPEFQRSTSPLTVCLGQDIGGRPVVASLPRLFHLLVAGATGSGKSITLNAMLISILYKARPDEVKLVLIDPKMVELTLYNGIPHLLAPVVTDPRKAAATLRTVVREMEKRYSLFTEAGARDLPRYNAIVAERGLPPLPYVVVVIDELADLMLVARGEVEDAIQRLTQMARAAGIHLIVATQRPSVDVITGVIKANIPSRIALTVSSQVDSRTILDAAGAEKLVGRGDMLFRPVGAQKVTRAQGAFIADTEVEAVLDFLRSAGRPEYDTAIMEAEPDEEGRGAESDEDELFVDALQIVVESRQASVSNLQRRLRVGFTRAGRLVDMMEQRGYVGPHQGSKSREVLLTADQFARLFGERGERTGPGVGERA